MTEEAFSSLYRAYKHRLVRLAQRNLQDPHLAEDIAHETLLKAHGLLPAWATPNPWPWLSRVARNACEDLRRSRRETVGRQAEEAAARERAESATERREAVEAVQRALEDLTPIQRETIELAHYEERSYAEIASFQGTRVEDVRDRLHYTRGKLKTKLRQFADYPLSALVPVFKARVWRLKSARVVSKAATVAAVSVTAVVVLGPSEPWPSQAVEAPAQTVTAPMTRDHQPVGPGPHGMKESISSAKGAGAGVQGSPSRRDLTNPVSVPEVPSPDGSGAGSGGSIGPVFVSMDCSGATKNPINDSLCPVWTKL